MTMDCRSASIVRAVAGSLPLLAAALLATSVSLARDASAPEPPDVVAVVAGSPISRQELLDATAEDLGKLDEERLELQVQYAKTRHRVLQQALHRLIQAKLLQTEAERRHLSVQQLVTQELTGKVKAVTPEQLDSFYKLNHVLIGKPEAEVAGELRAKLARSNVEDAKLRFVDELRRKYAAEDLLGPLRLPVGTTGPSRGEESAPVTLVEFADFECPYCAALAPLLRKAVASWPGQIRVVFRQFPLEETHSHAWLAAEAALCAGEQHRFWEMHDALFGDRTHLEKDQLTVKARKIGLDMPAFDQCLDSDRYTAQINHDIREGNALGVQGTPSLFINGRRVGGLTSLAELRAAIDAEIGGQRRRDEMPVPELTEISVPKTHSQY